MGDLNFNFEHPHDAREENIADLIDEINLVDTSRKFALQRCRMQSAKKRWTWRQKRMGRWYHTQPDYILLELSRTGTYVTYPYLESHESREPVPR
jgi:hypothetical protein